MPASDNYELQDYSFGSGTNNSTSENYGLFGILGEVEFGNLTSENFQTHLGLTYLTALATPPAPTFTNPGTNYDRLHLTINTGDNPSETLYAIAISADNFTDDIRYIKNDNTIGDTLETNDYKTYAGWGGATGEYVTGLMQETTYTIKVRAKQNEFTESVYSPVASATTSTAQLTFSVNSPTITFNNLNSSNNYTDESKTTVLTTSTNAYNGYVVNARQTQQLTAIGIGTISDFTSPNSAPTSWSGYGFGYTTNDSDLTGGTANRFTNGGPNYAGFTTASPGDPVADHPGPITTAISNEQFTITYKVAVSNTQPAAEYTTDILYIVVPSY
ncbi:MAG TPA: hypothetical protein VLF20_06085 [Patescibacteria group bacterium]|nr:hypothetical protein [Patescibacteria group bacterium]